MIPYVVLEQNRNALIKAGIIKILADLLAVEDEDEACIRYALVALFRLVSNKGRLSLQNIKVCGKGRFVRVDLF